MARADRSRDSLISTTVSLLRRQGYAATGTAQILAESGATTGSLYHHFPGGKEALAAEAIGAAGADVAHRLRGSLQSSADLATVISRWMRGLAKALANDPRDGCPIMPMAVESISGSPLLREATTRAFASWHDLLAQRLRADGRSSQRADEDATVLLALIEGALLLARTSGDLSVIDAAARGAARLIAASTEDGERS